MEGPNATAWRERLYLGATGHVSSIQGCKRTHPRISAELHMSCTEASATSHSPSERKMTTGELA
jgi:hypothetical protein